MIIKIANRENPDQTSSSEAGLYCLSRPFLKETSGRNFNTFTILCVFAAVSFFFRILKWIFFEWVLSFLPCA